MVSNVTTPKTLNSTMTSTDDKTGAALAHEVSHVDHTPEKGIAVKETAVASVALAAAHNSKKPNLWSANMIRLYFILGIGYLVSTMNVRFVL